MANFTAAEARPPVPTGEVDNFVEFILHGVITNAVAFVGFIGNLGIIHIFRKHFYDTKLLFFCRKQEILFFNVTF